MRFQGNPSWGVRCGDVRAELRDVPSEVQCCISSPPFWGLRDYGHPGQLGLERTPQQYVDNLVGVFADVRDRLRADGTLWLNLGDSYARSGVAPPRPDHSGTRLTGTRGHQAAARAGAAKSHRQSVPAGLKEKDLVGIPWMVAFALRDDGWYLRSSVIWHKPNAMPESVADRPTCAHEYLFLLSKSRSYFYDAQAVMEESVAGHSSGVKDRGSNHNPRANFSTRVPWVDEGQGRNRRSVWSIPTKPFAGAHFAVMPEALVEPCVLAGSSEGDLVLDPFCGSGTVGVVALRHRRSFIGIDINPSYCELARSRIEGDAPLFNRSTHG